MRKILTTWALCALAFSASAQCVLDAHAPTAQQAGSSGWIKTASAGTTHTDAVQPRAMMKVAAREAGGLQQAALPAAQHKADMDPGEDHRRRNGPAMLFAVLAVMTAIALRRLGASDR